MKRPDFSKIKTDAKVLNGQILKRYNNLKAVKGLLGAKANYAVGRNITLLEPYAIELAEETVLGESTVQIKEYLKKREAINHEFSGGKTIPYRKPDGSVGYNYDVDLFNAEYRAKIEALEAEYKEDIDQANKEREEYNDILREEFPVDIKYYTIPLSLAPKDERQQLIMFMIKEVTVEEFDAMPEEESAE